METQREIQFLGHLRRLPLDRGQFLKAVGNWITTKVYLARASASRQGVGVSDVLRSWRSPC